MMDECRYGAHLLRAKFLLEVETVPLSNLMNDNVDILRSDGTELNGRKASVQRNKIYMDADGLLIEPGDLVLRRMSNGAQETYRVIDPGFYESFGGIPANYQMEVQKLGVPEARSALHNITYNITGNNARLNVNSSDNSSNTVTIDMRATELIVQLRQEIDSAALSSDQKQDAVDIVDEIETAVTSGSPKRSVLKALLVALPQIANVATIGGALLALFS